MDAEAIRLSDSDLLSITSETHDLIDRALAAVRETAKLDDDPVLPPLPAIAPRRNVVMFKPAELPLPSPSEIALGKSSSRARAAAAKTVCTRGAATPKAPSSRWAVILCAFVASVAAGAAISASPLGQRPAMREAKSAAHAKVTGALSAAKHVIAR